MNILSTLFLKLSKEFALFHLALCFSSRLGTKGSTDAAELSQAMLYLPFAGLTLGCLGAFPLYLGLFSEQSALQAWFYLAAIAYLTRGLHYDGLADLCDGLGSQQKGERFFQILKDSRVGVFACLALIFVITGKMLALNQICMQKQFLPLLLAPAWGRCFPLALNRLAKPSLHAQLGQLMQHIPKNRDILFVGLWIVATAFFIPSWNSFLIINFFSLLLLLGMKQLADKYGGFNGDFLGAAIVSGELIFYLAWPL